MSPPPSVPTDWSPAQAQSVAPNIVAPAAVTALLT